MVGPDSTGIPRAPAYSGDSCGSRQHFAYGAFTLYGMLSQYTSTTLTVSHSRIHLRAYLRNSLNPEKATAAALTLLRFGLLPFRSPLLRVSLRFLLLGLLRCFTSPGSSRFAGDWTAPVGLPHSDTSGSRNACFSPELFAAGCVLHRLMAPRHPPCALSTFSSFQFFFLYSDVNVHRDLLIGKGKEVCEPRFV